MTTRAVSGTRRAMRELVDGSIRVQIDIDPKFRKEFLEMFSDIDMPVALAPLSPDFERSEPAQQEKRGSSWAGLGPLAQSAVLLCKEPSFQRYVVEMRGASSELPTEEGSASYIRSQCGLASRKDLDMADGARERFGALMADYREWLHGRGGR